MVLTRARLEDIGHQLHIDQQANQDGRCHIERNGRVVFAQNLRANKAGQETEEWTDNFEVRKYLRDIIRRIGFLDFIDNPRLQGPRAEGDGQAG